jgi:glycosyltransferase involved in cell wall biosynthesis
MEALFFLRRADWAGPARAFVQAARGLMARGIEVAVMCPAGSEVAARATADGVSLIELPQHAGIVGTVLSLSAAIRRGGADVVFADSADDLRVAEFARRIGGRGTVVRTPPSVELLGVDVKAVDAMVRVGRVSLGVPGRGPLLGCWCGNDAHVAVVHALRALGKVADRHGDLHIVMVGPGAADDTLRVHAAALGLHGGLTWIHEDGAALGAFRAADIGWVAADGADAAFAMLECMAARVPVVARDGPLARHFLGAGDAGVLLHTADADRSAAEVARLLAHPAYRARLGNAGRARVELRFTEAAMVDAFGEALPRVRIVRESEAT